MRRNILVRITASPLALAIVALAALISPVCAHPISVTDCFLRVDQHQADAEITIFLEDLYFFQNLAPDERDFLPLDAIRKGAAQHREFLLKRFVLRDAAGERLNATFMKLEMPELPAAGVPLADLMSHKLSYRFRFTFAEPPEFLTVSQHLVDELVAVPAEMRLVAQQAGSGAAFSAVLDSEEPQTMRFDWVGPLLAEKPTPEQLEDWFAEQRKKTLGITSYSSLYAFLYVEDFELRLEVLIPLVKLDEMSPLEREDRQFITPAEQDAAREQLMKHFQSIANLSVDGMPVQPTVSRLDFFGIDSKDFAKPADRKRVSMASGRVGAIMNIPLKTPARDLDMKWNGFSDSLYTMQLFFFTGDNFERKTLARLGGANRFIWKRDGELPRASSIARPEVRMPARKTWTAPWVSVFLLVVAGALGCVRSTRKLALGFSVAAVVGLPITWTTANPLARPPQIAEARAGEVVLSLIKNTYAAFRLRDEEATYDHLNQSADGPLLDKLYTQIRRSMVMQQQGGAVATVRDIQALTGRREPARLDDERGFRYRMSWSVAGDVEHWGHVHSRANRYDALFTVEPREDYWLFTDLEVLQEERLQAKTVVRGRKPTAKPTAKPIAESDENSAKP